MALSRRCAFSVPRRPGSHDHVVAWKTVVMTVAVNQCHIDRKIDAGTGHHLAFKSVAVNIDDTGQSDQAIAVEADGSRSAAGRDFRNPSICNMNGCIDEIASDQCFAAFNQYVHHVPTAFNV